MANQVLLRAADRIERLGWCQYNYGILIDGKPTRPGYFSTRSEDVAETDVIGAIRDVAADGASGDEAKAILCKLLKVDNLADWNDDPKRTKAEVVATLRKAAQ